MLLAIEFVFQIMKQLKDNPITFFFFLVFQDRVSLYSPGYPGTHFVDQAGLKLRNPPASASQVLELKACATTTRLHYCFNNWFSKWFVLGLDMIS